MKSNANFDAPAPSASKASAGGYSAPEAEGLGGLGGLLDDALARKDGE